MYSVINKLPKVEQHIHLLGSIRPETLMWVADNSGLENRWDSVDEVKEFFKFRDFPHFLDVFTTCITYVTKESMFERLAYETFEDQASQNVLHSEIIFSAPQRVKRANMDFGLIMKAYNRGIRRAERDFNVTCSTRIDLIRARAPAQFKAVYEKARGMGLRLAARAGEAAGPESVIDAVNVLGVERIGHGFTAKDSPKALELLKKRGITVETSP